MGSACEVEYYLLLAKDLRFLPVQDCERIASLVTEVKRMLASLIRRIRAGGPPSGTNPPQA